MSVRGHGTKTEGVLMQAKRSALILAVLVSLAAPATASAWPTWGNLTSGDCALAAAANWETLHGGTSATEASILAEYNTLSPEDDGIDGDTLERHWRVHGIGGRRVNVHGVTPDNLRRIMRQQGPVIAELAVTPGQKWGDVLVELGGIHFAVVRYITRRGPVLLTWGQLAQMTWWQWREDALLLYPAGLG